MISSENLFNDTSDWRKAFTAVAEQMYALLNACPRRALLACSTVNPRHPLPKDHLELVNMKMNPSALPLDYRPKISSQIIAFIKSIVFAICETSRIIFVHIRFYTDLRVFFREPANVVMKTWFFATPQDEGYDFYYGDLPNLLRINGLHCMLLGGNSGVTSTGTFVRGLLKSGRKAVPESALVPLWGPASIIFDQVRTSIVLTKLGCKSKNRIFSAVAFRASLECLKPATLQQALHFYIAKCAVEKWNPKFFATLYEGQPWEKLAWLGAKAANSECITLGYQHTIVMPHSWGLLRPNFGSWEFPAPDKVLALGNITIAMMKKGQQEFKTTFVPLGSFRRTTNGHAMRSPTPSQRVVLVVPEGIIEEATLLFEQAIQTAIMTPDHQFIFRCHPVLPFNQVRDRLSIDVSRITNVEISTRVAIEEDFARSSVVLYRGSSVVLYGILSGLKPYYLNEPGRPFVDPLFHLKEWRESIDTATQLSNALHDYTQMDPESARVAWAPAKTFVDQYSITINESAISQAFDISSVEAKVKV
ncbi:hypothetical protein ACFLSY_00915 [Bacteroidota bacterium]